MPGLIGRKIGMTNIFSDDGNQIPVTVLEAGPCKVVSVKSKNSDGYEALQLGYGKANSKKINKPIEGHFAKAGVEPLKTLKEFKGFNVDEYKAGDEINAGIFQVGDSVKVAGMSKGKGFQGVMKRHGFGGVGGATHGQHNRLRAPGSIGQSSWPSRVFKGTRMAGRKGYSRVTVSNLKIVKIDLEKNIIMIKGAVPGSINSIVEIIK